MPPRVILAVDVDGVFGGVQCLIYGGVTDGMDGDLQPGFIGDCDGFEQFFSRPDGFCRRAVKVGFRAVGSARIDDAVRDNLDSRESEP